MEKIRFVVASRMNVSDFYQRSPLGRSIDIMNRYVNKIYGSDSKNLLELELFPMNRDGLPKVYNQAIRRSLNDPAILVFIHDDVHICDFYWTEHLQNALQVFDIVGVVGNKNRVKGQASWAIFNSEGYPHDSPDYSGGVGHGKGFPPDFLSIFGAPCQEVKLLDGVVLACRSETLHRNQILFDEVFDFHFYDLDFCRQAELKKITMGTWTLSVVHESDGSFKKNWVDSMELYFGKWGG